MHPTNLSPRFLSVRSLKSLPTALLMLALSVTATQAKPDLDHYMQLNVSASAFTGGESADPMYGAGVAFGFYSFKKWGVQFLIENYAINDLVHLLAFDADRLTDQNGLYFQHGLIGSYVLGLNVFKLDGMVLNLGVSHSDYLVGGDPSLAWIDRYFMAAGAAVGANLELSRQSALFLTGRVNMPYRQSEGTQIAGTNYENVNMLGEPWFYDLSAIYRVDRFSLDYAALLHDGYARHQVRLGVWFDPL